MKITYLIVERKLLSQYFFGLFSVLLFLVSCNASQPRLKQIAQEMTDELASSSELKKIARKTAKDLISSTAKNYSPKYAKDVEALFDVLSSPVPASVAKEGVIGAKSSTTEGATTRGLVPISVSASASDDAGYRNQKLTHQDEIGLNPNEEISIDIGMLVQRKEANAFSDPVVIKDGEQLYSDPSNPLNGDKIKITFQANCHCYTYIISVDSSGFVSPIYPDYRSPQVNRVTANQQMTIPEKNKWLTLDGKIGVETIYVITALHRLPELESKIKSAANNRHELQENYTPVQQVTNLSRGIVKVKAGEIASINDFSGEPHSFSPTNYISEKGGDYLAVTRWFFQENIQGNRVSSNF